jgi:prophage maintenance system killer protein
MIRLDVAALVVIAGEVLGCGADAALARLDAAAAEAALAEAAQSSTSRMSRPDRAHAAGAAVALMQALLRHPPFPGHREQMAAAAGLQFLAVNGWQANLDVPRAAAIIIERLASGRLDPADAAVWLMIRLSRDPASPGREKPMRTQPPSVLTRIMRRPMAAIRRRRHHRRPPRPAFVIAVRSGETPGGINTTVTGFMPFTGHASNAVTLARQETRRLGRPRGPEHILLGLVGEADSLAAKALERLGVSPDAVREQVEQITVREQPPPSPGWIPEAPQARRVWHAVVDEAVARGDDYIGTEHFLLALFCDDEGAAAQALARLGAGEPEVRDAVTALLAESGRERSA